MVFRMTSTGFRLQGNKHDLLGKLAANKGQTVKAFILNDGPQPTVGEQDTLVKFITERNVVNG